jgi:UDP-N-acetylglucosamine:LPS N-acetylglucosamine transferase
VGQGSSRVLIVSASMAAGHDGVALELQRRLAELGHAVRVRDYLSSWPFHLGYLLRHVYAKQLKLAPSTYGAVYHLTAKCHPCYILARWVAFLGCPKLKRWARGYDVIVATYPLAGQALSHLRKLGMSAKVVIFLTDFSVHPLWVSRYADLHLTVAPDTAEQILLIEPHARVEVGGALVRPEFARCSQDRRATSIERHSTALSQVYPVALLVAGSWGVGEVAKVAKELRANGAATPVIVCGENRRLYRALQREGLGHVLGWVDDMASLLKTVDVLVHNSGGLTCLEGLAADLPVVGYRCLPGHGHCNSEAMARAGVAIHACPDKLVDVLRSLDKTEARRLNIRAKKLFLIDPAAFISQILYGLKKLLMLHSRALEI